MGHELDLVTWEHFTICQTYGWQLRVGSEDICSQRMFLFSGVCHLYGRCLQRTCPDPRHLMVKCTPGNVGRDNILFNEGMDLGLPVSGNGRLQSVRGSLAEVC